MEMQKTRARRKQRRKQEIYIGAVGRTIIKYAILTLIGIVLFRAGAAAGLRAVRRSPCCCRFCTT